MHPNQESHKDQDDEHREWNHDQCENRIEPERNLKRDGDRTKEAGHRIVEPSLAR